MNTSGGSNENFVQLAKALCEFNFQKNAANGIASRTSANSNENKTTPPSAMPIQTTIYPLKQSSLPEQSKTPPFSWKKSSKPWDSALDRRAETSTSASASKPRGRTSPFRHNSAREMSDCPARSKSPLRRFFSLRSAMGTADRNTDPVETVTAKVASSVSCAPNVPVGVSSTPRNAGVPQSTDLFTPVDTKKSTSGLHSPMDFSLTSTTPTSDGLYSPMDFSMTSTTPTSDVRTSSGLSSPMDFSLTSTTPTSDGLYSPMDFSMTSTTPTSDVRTSS